MIKLKSKIFTILILFLLLGCNNSTKPKANHSAPEVNNLWINKKIVIPPTVKALDIVNYNRNKKEAKFTIVSSFDGNCPNCYKEILKLNNILIEIVKNNNNVNYIYILSGFNIGLLEVYLEEINVSSSNVLFDEMDDFNNNYGFMREDGHYLNSTILLDKNNKVLCVGNPTKSIAIKKKYIELIKKL